MNLKELSQLLGLSATTVSRALNGYPEVNAATRQRVIAAAREHGYAPNRVAQRLATGRSRAIGHVVPLAAHQMINPIFADFIAGAGETYSAAGYDMIVSVVPAEVEHDAYRALAAQAKVDGVIVHAPKVIDERIDLLNDLGLPFLVHGRDGRPNENYSWIDMNNRRAFQRATEFLIDLGHRRIGLINGMETMSFAQRRRMGYEQALCSRDIAVEPELIHSGEMVESFGHARTLELLGDTRPPTAILVSSIYIALGALRAVRDKGMELGRDVSIITHDDDLSFLRNGDPEPLFTATRCSVRATGRKAAEMLITLIENPDQAPLNELLEAELTLGKSTGPRMQEAPRA